MKKISYLCFVFCLVIFLSTLDTALACINDYGCMPGYKCLKVQYESEGTCVKIGNGDGRNPYAVDYEPLNKSIKDLGDTISNAVEQKRLRDEERQRQERERLAREAKQRQSDEAKRKYEQNKENYNDALKEINKKGMAICENPEYEVIFVNSPCLAKDITFEHITDNTKISKKQKAIYLKYRKDYDAFRKERIEHMRTNGLKFEKMAADYFESKQAEADKYYLDLFNGAITWGKFNQWRKNSAEETNVTMSKIREEVRKDSKQY